MHTLYAGCTLVLITNPIIGMRLCGLFFHSSGAFFAPKAKHNDLLGSPNNPSTVLIHTTWVLVSVVGPAQLFDNGRGLADTREGNSGRYVKSPIRMGKVIIT